MKHLHGVPVRSDFEGVVLPCSRCSGSGTVRRRWALRDLWIRVNGKVDCPECLGLGYFVSPISNHTSNTPTTEFPVMS
jgi:hypothetical protein